MSDFKKNDQQLATDSLSTQISVDSTHPSKVKNISLNILAFIAVIMALNFAQSFFVTLLLSIFLALTLNPIVAFLIKLKVPRTLGASIVVVLLIMIISLSIIGLKSQAESIITQLPGVTKKITSLMLANKSSSLSSVKKMQLVATQVQSVTNSEDRKTNGKSITHVIVQEEPFRLNDFLWRGSLGFAGAVGEFITVVFLAYFLLISGDMFKRKFVKLSGPTISSRKITVNILQDINQSIQKYLFMLLVTNILVGLLIWVALSLIGLENAGAWGLAAGLIHFIPYFGPFIISLTLSTAALIQFNSVSMALITGLVSISIATIVGVFITTWMTGRIAKMNSVAVFISLLFFTWLWGIWGMLLGVPIVVVIKVISEHLEQLKPIAELLGE
ncbi:AI-2E family transporter [Methylotenera sp.]|uniref:AI-2E family transporter n=1 Tax=Methylotenera sp. TaxID=2051956 RepID=UPI002487BDB6|nr:AI-2E family transporter [Methylotenera sp.]MDI1299956.1 AI-2E family transporter [Methylotenera sp.]